MVFATLRPTLLVSVPLFEGPYRRFSRVVLGRGHVRVPREGRLSVAECRASTRAFLQHVASGSWTLIPFTEPLLGQATSISSAAAKDLFFERATSCF